MAIFRLGEYSCIGYLGLTRGWFFWTALSDLLLHNHCSRASFLPKIQVNWREWGLQRESCCNWCHQKEFWLSHPRFLLLLSRVDLPNPIASSPLERVLTSLHYQHIMQPSYSSGTTTLVLGHLAKELTSNARFSKPLCLLPSNDWSPWASKFV